MGEEVLEPSQNDKLNSTQAGQKAELVCWLNTYVCSPGGLWTSGKSLRLHVWGSRQNAGCLCWSGKAGPGGLSLWQCPESLYWLSFPVSE